MKNILKYIFVLTAIIILSQIVKAQETGSGSRIPKGYMLIEGDMIVPVDFYEKACWLIDSYWPKVSGVYTVPYTYDAGLTTYQKSQALTAMNLWEAEANINFVARSSQTDYITFYAGTGNSSHVGRKGGQQFIEITSWDMEYRIAHEICHALGFWHEQSRPDRDTYVTINYNCIDTAPEDYTHNFDKHNDAGYYGPYDFTSVMHYGGDYFYDCCDNASCNKNGLTIIVKAPYTAYQDSIGQRNRFSYWDSRMMSFIYPYSNWRFARGPYTGTESGSFEEPYNTFNEGYNSTPSGGKLWIRAGSIDAQNDVTYDKAMTIEPTWGDVEIY
jgi:hypothetical protein